MQQPTEGGGDDDAIDESSVDRQDHRPALAAPANP